MGRRFPRCRTRVTTHSREACGEPTRATAIVHRCDTGRTSARLTVELERERGGEKIAPIRVAPDDLEPGTLRAVIESFVLREGTDYGVHETSLEAQRAGADTASTRRGAYHVWSSHRVGQRRGDERDRRIRAALSLGPATTSKRLVSLHLRRSR